MKTLELTKEQIDYLVKLLDAAERAGKEQQPVHYQISLKILQTVK